MAYRILLLGICAGMLSSSAMAQDHALQKTTCKRDYAIGDVIYKSVCGTKSQWLRLHKAEQQLRLQSPYGNRGLAEVQAAHNAMSVPFGHGGDPGRGRR